LLASPYESALSDLESLERIILSGEVEEFQTIGGSSIYHDPKACIGALHQVIIDAAVREGLPWNPPATEAYARKIYSEYPVPVMNSPISGASIMQMVTAAGSGAAFMAAFPHPDLGQVTIYFLLIGSTKIVLGAADGISMGLKQGLSHLILKWMGVPASAANPKKQTTKRASKSASA
jgi:hypothetical protein